MPARVRLWCATLFEPTNGDIEHLNSCVERGDVTYWCGQGESCPTTKRLHLQFFLCLAQARTLIGVKRLMFVSPHLRTVRLAVAKGTMEQNRAYCSKAESSAPGAGFPFCETGEFADCPERNGQGERSDLYAIGQRLIGGASLEEIAQDHPDAYIKFYRGLESLRSRIFSVPRPWSNDTPYVPCNVKWYYGSSGSGKSREAFTEASSDPLRTFYTKSSGNKWWDGYLNQPIVILDDFRADWFTFSYLIRLIDCYPLSVEVKGGMVAMSADTFIITCPMRPEHLFAKLNASDDGRMLQLTRRITETRLFGEEPPAPAPYVEGFRP